MASRGLYIHFDGMDLAGKTTATRGFVRATGRNWEVRRNALVEGNPIYKLADSLRRADAYDAEVLGNLYVAALMADIRGFTWPEQDTLQDSTVILRSLAYHSVRGTPRIAQVMMDVFPEHPRFDASFVFTASLKKRVRRLEMRITRSPQEVGPEDMMVINQPEKFLAMETCLIDIAKRCFRSVVIDTSDLTPEEVVALVVDRIPAPLCVSR